MPRISPRFVDVSAEVAPIVEIEADWISNPAIELLETSAF